MTRESGLAPIARRFPHWEIWRGTSGLLYARPAGTRDQPVAGEDATDLADQITRAEALAQPAEQPGSSVYWSSQDVQLARDARALEEMLRRPCWPP